MISINDIRKNKEISNYIEAADSSLSALGYTEHSYAHVTRVSELAALVLESLGYEEREVELARIAGFMHDIGNLVNRDDHSQSGALMAFYILSKMGMDSISYLQDKAQTPQMQDYLKHEYSMYNNILEKAIAG